MKEKLNVQYHYDLRTVKIQFLEYTWIYLSSFDLAEKLSFGVSRKKILRFN